MAQIDQPDARLEDLDFTTMWSQTEDDLFDFILVAARMATAGPERYSLNDVLGQFGYTRDQLRDMPD